MASLVKVLVHVVFSTRKRVPFIDAALSADLYPYMAGIVRHKRATLLALGSMPDHLRALIRLKADLSLSDTVRALKAVSSKPFPGFPPRADQILPFQGSPFEAGDCPRAITTRCPLLTRRTASAGIGTAPRFGFPLPREGQRESRLSSWSCCSARSREEGGAWI